MNEKTDMVTERLMDRQLHGRGLFKRGEGWEERRKLVPPWTPFQCLVWELPQTYWRLLIPSMPYYMYFISFCVLIGKAPTTSKGRQACIWRLQMDTKSQWHFHIATRRRREMSKRYCENYRLKLVSVWVRSRVGWGVGGRLTNISCWSPYPKTGQVLGEFRWRVQKRNSMEYDN